MVGTGPEADAATAAFRQYWENTAALAGGVLVYNTGRSLGQFQELMQSKADSLAVPNALITAVGTKVCWVGLFVILKLAGKEWQCLCKGCCSLSKVRAGCVNSTKVLQGRLGVPPLLSQFALCFWHCVIIRAVLS